MTDNVGLTTPRGSGTSGYVQRNLSHLKPRSHPYMRGPSGLSSSASPYDNEDRYKQREPDAEILDHERKRAIELKVFELRDKLEEEGKLDEDEVDAECEALRRKLSETAPPSGPRGRDGRSAGKGQAGTAGRKDIKSYDVHALAAAKIEETEKLRNAFGISKDYEEGGHWKRQEERKREGMARGAEEGARRRERD
jgi:hypothetical protein